MMESFKQNIIEYDMAIEAMLPNFINKLLTEKSIELELLMTNSKWCGVTFKEDIPMVKSILLGN